VFVEDSHPGGTIRALCAVELDLGVDKHPLASTVPRTEPPPTALALKPAAAVAGGAVSAGLRPPSRNDAARDPSTSGACWSAGLGKEFRALAESPSVRALQAGQSDSGCRCFRVRAAGPTELLPHIEGRPGQEFAAGHGCLCITRIMHA